LPVSLDVAGLALRSSALALPTGFYVAGKDCFQAKSSFADAYPHYV